jgi:hypothetical protein
MAGYNNDKRFLSVHPLIHHVCFSSVNFGGMSFPMGKESFHFNVKIILIAFSHVLFSACLKAFLIKGVKAWRNH